MIASTRTALLVCGAIVLTVSACAGSLTQLVEEEAGAQTLVHSGAFAQQLRLLNPDTSTEQLALTEDDTQYFGITVDEGKYCCTTVLLWRLLLFAERVSTRLYCCRIRAASFRAASLRVCATYSVNLVLCKVASALCLCTQFSE